MASLTKKHLKEVPIDDLGGGLNEASLPNDVPIKECIVCENFRASDGGKGKKKRKGLSKIDSIYDFGTKKVFGIYGIEEPEEVEIASFLEDDIQLKSGDLWNSIFSPTKEIDKQVSIVQDKELVFVAGYEKILAIKEGEAFYAGVEPPQTAPTVELQDASTDTKVTEYPASNQDHAGELRSLAANTLLAQSFKLEGPSRDVTKIALKLRKIGNPTGELWVEIHSARGGTSETKNASIYIAGQASDNLDVSTIRTSFFKVTGTTIAFVSATKKITDSNNGLAGFLTGDKIKVTGSTENDGIYTIATGGVAGEIVVEEDLVDESAGASVTIDMIYVLTFSGSKPGLSADKIYYIVVYGGGTFAVNATNFVEVGFDCSSPSYEGGKYWKLDGSLNWKGNNAVDLVFELYGVSSTSESLLQFGDIDTGYNYDVRTDLWKMLGQSFKLPHASTIDKIKIPIKKWYGNKSKSFPGECWVEIHSSTVGTSEYRNESANQVGDASDVVNIPDMAEDFEWVEFDFSNTKPSLAADTTYYLVFYAGFDVSRYLEGNWLEWSYVLGNYYADGGMWRIANDMSWSDLSGVGDFCFEVIGKFTEESLFTKYDFSNLDDIKGLRETTGQTLLAQSFKVLKSSSVSKINLYLSRIGNPTGVMWAEIHSAHGETSTEKNLSANILPEASDNVDVATIPVFPTYGWVTFTFSGTKPSLELDTEYFLVIYGNYTISTSDFIKVGMDKVDPTYGNGKRWEINESLDWIGQDFIDLIFEIYLLASEISGERSYVVTYLRGGNYPCESNPSPISEKIDFVEGKSGKLSNIPVSSNPQVTEKNIYRNKKDEEKRYWLARINNNVTDFEDSIPDDGLGDEVSYENNVPFAGDFIEIWDNTSWISGVPGYPEGLFKSRLGFLEQFPSLAKSYFPLKEDQSDRVIRPVEFNNYLYPFKTSSIWVISRSGENYVIDKIVDGTGTPAGASIVECNMKEGRVLVFLSNHYRIEIMDGFGRLIAPKISAKVKKTLKSINKEYAFRSTAQNYDGHEYRLAIPTGSSTVPNKVVVFDYLKMNFYVDTHYQKICSLSTTNLAAGRRETIFGTDSGEALKIDEDATTDDGHIIYSKFRTGWMGGPLWKRLREIWLDYVLPVDKNLVFKIYSNFREVPDLSIVLPGSTPSGMDADLRNIIHKKLRTAVNGDYYSFYFANSEDVGGELEINKIWLYLQIEKAKRTVKAS